MKKNARHLALALVLGSTLSLSQAAFAEDTPADPAPAVTPAQPAPQTPARPAPKAPPVAGDPKAPAQPADRTDADGRYADCYCPCLNGEAPRAFADRPGRGRFADGRGPRFAHHDDDYYGPRHHRGYRHHRDFDDEDFRPHREHRMVREGRYYSERDGDRRDWQRMGPRGDYRDYGMRGYRQHRDFDREDFRDRDDRPGRMWREDD